MHEGFWQYFVRLVSSLKPCPPEPTEQRHYCTKGKRFYSQFVPFIHYRGKARKSRQLMEKKEDLLGAEGIGWKEIEDLNVFFRPFPSSPSAIFFTFQGKKLSSLSGGNFFLSNLQMQPHPLLPPIPLERTSSKFGMRSSYFVCTHAVNLSSPQILREAEGHISFICLSR